MQNNILLKVFSNVAGYLFYDFFFLTYSVIVSALIIKLQFKTFKEFAKN